MALIIKGDMPKGKCWWHDENGKEHECQFFPCGHNSSDCPIIGEIPDEHGRLVDADKLAEKLQDFVDWCKDGRKQGAEFVLDCPLANAPTVVEASK